MLSEATVDETHLVLSSVTSASVLSRTAEQFATVGVNSLILTKLDEAGALDNTIIVAASADEAAPMTWRLRKETAGSGAMGDLASHAVDQVQFLLGERAASVSATINTFVPQRTGPNGREPVTVDDAAWATLRMPSGAVARDDDACNPGLAYLLAIPANRTAAAVATKPAADSAAPDSAAGTGAAADSAAHGTNGDSAASADTVPGRLRAVQPSTLRCGARVTPRFPAGTSSLIALPAAT